VKSTGKETWSFAGADIDTTGGTISALVRSFGCFALLEDTLYPRIWDLRPKEGARLKGEQKRLFARIKDQGAGIGREKDLVMELDGQQVISEYDPEGRWLKWEAKEPFSPGPHIMKVTVTDQAGNTTTKESRFSVTP